MRRSVHFHSQIEEQLSEIMFWYDDHRPGLGDFFIEKFDDSIKYIADFPEAVEIKRKKYRIVKIDNFPYVIVFELRRLRVDVLSVTHTSRHPGMRFKRK